MMNGSIIHIRQRHANLIDAVEKAVSAAARPDQRVIVLVYDGPGSLTRELSYFAPHQNHNDVRLVLQACVEQIK